MSIAIALLGQNCGIVATDSQITGNVGNIISSNFDKTFQLFEGLVAIAQVGIIDIGGLFVSAEITNLFIGQPVPTTLSSVVKTIKTGLEIWLNNNYTNIPPNSSRGVELLIVGKEKITHGNYKIVCIEIGETYILSGIYNSTSKVYSKNGANAQSGDANARAAITSYISATKAANTRYQPTNTGYSSFNSKKLGQLADILINIGINNSGSVIGFPNTPACGGIPMTKSV